MPKYSYATIQDTTKYIYSTCLVILKVEQFGEIFLLIDSMLKHRTSREEMKETNSGTNDTHLFHPLGYFLDGELKDSAATPRPGFQLED